jgi:thiol-disulfide isomerase/thioredoxin
MNWTTKIQKTQELVRDLQSLGKRRHNFTGHPSVSLACLFFVGICTLPRSLSAMKNLGLIFFVLVVSHSALSQGCFGRCRDHLLLPPSEHENLQARTRMSEKILQGLVGCRAPEFNVTSITGDTLNTKALLGKVVVINFWFESCVPCLAELPALNKLAEEYKTKDVVFIAFGRDAKARIEEFLRKKTFDYTMVAAARDISEKFCVIGGWPMNLVLDKKGIVRFIHAGGATGEAADTEAFDLMKPVIDESLAK